MADIPAGWRDVMHPRRHGMIAVEPAHDSGEDAGRERVADHPLTDSVASAWNSLRRKAKPLIADQTARLEEAMIAHRRASASRPDRSQAGMGARRQHRSQPFVQAGREVFAGEDPSAWWQRTVEAAALYRLVRHGWHWGPAGRQARRGELFRPFGAEGRVVLTIDPGW